MAAPTILDAQAEAPAPTTVGPEAIAVELRRIAKQGLPIDLPRFGTVLPNLRSVLARSVHPDDLVSRLDALNQLLVRFLGEAGGDARGEAIRIVFAVAKNTRGTSLMQRRANAAAVLGYDPDHFRKNIEPKLIGDLAVTVHRDLLRYKSRAKRAVESLEPTGDTPSLNETHFTHQEELVSRIWEKVYALRAEHIAAGRRERAANAETLALEIAEHQEMAVQEESALRVLIAEYKATYGDGLIRHGEVEYEMTSFLNDVNESGSTPG